MAVNIVYFPVGWQDAPDHKTTPINAENLNHMDSAIEDAYVYITQLKNQYNEVAKYSVFTVFAGQWTANSDSATSTDYPYVNELTNLVPDLFGERPIWDLNGTGTIPTAAERADIDKVLEAVFTPNQNKIVLYATGLPTHNLVLRTKG